MIDRLTLITEDSTPIRLANTLPGTSITISVLAPRIDHAVRAKWAFPPWTAPVIKNKSN